MSLPKNCTRISYIQSSGTQYIDTGCIATADNFRVAIDFAYTSVGTVQSIFGVQNSSSSPYGIVPYIATAGTSTLYLGTSTQILSVSVSADGRNEWDITAASGTATWNYGDGTKTASYSGTPNQAYSYFIFANSKAGTASQFCSAKLYSMKIYDNGTLVRDYIPCVDESGVACLYDDVNGEFYYNAGTGDFMAGPVADVFVSYLESTGTQYFDTGFTPNQDTRVVMDFQSTLTTGGWPIFGSRASSSSNTYTFGSTSSNNAWVSGYNSSSVNSSVTEDANRHTVDKDKNVCYLDGAAIATSTYAAFTAPGSMWLCGFRSTDGNLYAQVCVYSCQIYDNGTLVRDYVPYVDTDGVPCLYDKVSKSCCYNAGTGDFGIGEIIEVGVYPPENLRVESATPTSITIEWDAVDGAAGYKVYRTGGLVSTQTETEFTDSDLPRYSAVEYGVTAYTDESESDVVYLTASTTMEVDPKIDLVTDRTQANSDRVATLTNKGWHNMTAEEQAEWAGGLKGAYNATDLNRVETAVAELSEILTNLPDEVKAYAEVYGVAWDAFFDTPYLVENIRTSTKTDWTNGDIPNIEDMERYLSNVKRLRNALEYATDELPSSMFNLTWRGANAIEKALVNLDAAISEYREHRKDQIDRTAAVFVPSGVFYGGSVIYIKSEDSETAAVLFVPSGADSLVLADGATFYSLGGN